MFSFDVTAKNAELFIYKLYSDSNVTTVNKAREMLFVKSSAPETLPSNTSKELTIKQLTIKQVCGDRQMNSTGGI